MKKIAQVLFLQIVLIFSFVNIVKAVDDSELFYCGQKYGSMSQATANKFCSCEATNNQTTYIAGAFGFGAYCCGFLSVGDSSSIINCSAYEDPNIYGCGETNGRKDPSETNGAVCQCEGADWTAYNANLIEGTNLCCGWVENGKCLRASPEEVSIAHCGETYATGTKQCACSGTGDAILMEDGENVCCGWLKDGSCQSSDVASVNDLEVSGKLLDDLNPLSTGDSTEDLSTPGGIISKALSSFIFPIAGIILFVVLLLGGFQMLTGATNSKSLEEGKQRITSAIIGFIILFAAYWIAQLLELIFGIRILS